jgi:hypothetical protein
MASLTQRKLSTLCTRAKKNITTTQDVRSFATRVSKRIKKLNPFHPRIHENDPPDTVIRKAMTVNKRASRRNTHHRRRRLRHHTRRQISTPNIVVIFGMLCAMVTLYGSASGTSIPSQQSAPPQRENVQTLHYKVAKILIEKMRTKLPVALQDLNTNRTKKGCWAWWAFPHNVAGQQEHEPKTYVNKCTAKFLIENAPNVWKEVLQKVCELLTDEHNEIGNMVAVIPTRDHDRVRKFIQFWKHQDQILHNTPWLREAIRTLETSIKRS